MSGWGFPRVKVCGVTRPEDAACAVALGARLIGVNFYLGSPRRVEMGQAREIAAAVDGRAGLVGVFVNAPDEEVDETLAAVGLDLIQFHGDEPKETVARFGARALWVVRVDTAPQDHPRRGLKPTANHLPWLRHVSEGVPEGRHVSSRGFQPPAGERPLPDHASESSAPAPHPVVPSVSEGPCWGLLFDLRLPHTFGGAGVAWDWGLAAPRIAAAGGLPTFIAGGIRPGNARRALAASGATGVDVCSGVESSPGVKDSGLLERLMAEVLA